MLLLILMYNILPTRDKPIATETLPITWGIRGHTGVVTHVETITRFVFTATQIGIVAPAVGTVNNISGLRLKNIFFFTFYFVFQPDRQTTLQYNIFYYFNLFF